MNEHQQILWRNVRCPTVSKQASSVNRWYHECMVLVTSVSQSFVGNISHVIKRFSILNLLFCSWTGVSRHCRPRRYSQQHWGLDFSSWVTVFITKKGEKGCWVFSHLPPLFSAHPCPLFMNNLTDEWIFWTCPSLVWASSSSSSSLIRKPCVDSRLIHSWDSLVPVGPMWGISGWQN